MNEIVKYDNSMNWVAFRRFNSRELDLFMTICSRLKNFNDEDEIVIDFYTIKSLTNINRVTKEEFIGLLKSMYDKLIKLDFSYDNEKEFVKFILFTKYKIDKDNETISIKINDEFKYILYSLTSNFTRFELNEFINFNSSYAKECYRRLKQFKTTGKWIINIDEFKRLLDIPEKYRMYDIDRYVLKPINNELSKSFNNLKITKIKKKGRGRGGQVDKIEFTFDPEKIPKIEKEDRKDKKHKFKTTAFHNYKQNQYTEDELRAITGLDKNKKK